MKIPVLVLSTAILLTGCASHPTGASMNERHVSTTEPGAGQTQVVLNTPVGKYMGYATRFVENDSAIVELTLAEPKDGTTWLPMSSACVGSVSPGHSVCLQFFVPRGKRELHAETAVVNEDGKTILATEPIGGAFAIGNKIRIDMRLEPGIVQFAVNGGAPSRYRLATAARTLELICSGALCKFDVQ